MIILEVGNIPQDLLEFFEPINNSKTTTWNVSIQPFNEAHFATFPPDLIKPMILAGCPEFICNKCGEPRVKIYEDTGNSTTFGGYGSKTADEVRLSPSSSIRTKTVKEKVNTGLSDCRCNAGFHPGIVLDPFMGAGTTAIVALGLNRDFIGIELNPEYIEIANRRLQNESGLLLEMKEGLQHG